MENSFVEIIQLVFFPTRFKSLWETIYELFSRTLCSQTATPSFRYTNVYTFYRARTHTRTHTRARNSGETNRRNDFEHWKRHSRRISNRHEIHATLTGKVTTRTVHVSRTTPVDWASRRAQAPDLSRARDVFLCCGVPFSLSLSLTLSLPLSSLFPSSSNHHAPSIHERVVTSSPLSFF